MVVESYFLGVVVYDIRPTGQRKGNNPHLQKSGIEQSHVGIKTPRSPNGLIVIRELRLRLEVGFKIVK